MPSPPGHELRAGAESPERDLDAALDDHVGDDLLSLMFTACHPVLSTEARTALTLRLLGGLTTDEIARAFLVPKATIAPRIVGAKRTLAAARVPFEVPRGADLAARLSSVLEVIYLVFNEGYAATAGDDWMRPALCEDALRLGRILAELVPQEPEVHGLVALMEIRAPRWGARVGRAGEPILLLDQDRGRWDHLLIRRGLAALERAEALGGGYGPYALQAAIAACHARARTPEETDWTRIVALYDALSQLLHSPVVELNRAVALAMAFGPAAGLEVVDTLTAEPSLERYHLLPAVRGRILLAVTMPLSPRGSPGRAGRVGGAAAGLAGGIGVALLYHALGIGTMAVVAPPTAVCAVAIPVVVSVLLGERPVPLAVAGIALGMVSIVLVSQQQGGTQPGAGESGLPRSRQSGVGTALVAGIAIGVFLLSFAQAGSTAGMWPLLVARTVSTTLFAVLAIAGGRSPPMPPP